jgi:murein DD-endopeptidase MepM/ murein hydrolase activator NlpD
VAALIVPATAPVGAPPAVSFQLRDSSARSIRVDVAIASLATRRAVLVASLGWLRAGAVIAVRWPSRARLSAGTYHVSIHARDSRGAALLRTSASSGVASFTVVPPPPAVPAAALAPPVIAPQPPPAAAPTPAQTLADGAVFPVAAPHNFGGPENRFGAPRGNHVHQGQDILAAEGSPVVAPLGGMVEWTSYQAAGAGWYAVERSDFGVDMMFAHCQAGSLDVTEGARLVPGEQICLVGQTGDATTPHLHFELWIGGWQAPGGEPIDPLPYLEAWERP